VRFSIVTNILSSPLRGMKNAIGGDGDGVLDDEVLGGMWEPNLDVLIMGLAGPIQNGVGVLQQPPVAQLIGNLG